MLAPERPVACRASSSAQAPQCPYNSSKFSVASCVLQNKTGTHWHGWSAAKADGSAGLFRMHGGGSHILDRRIISGITQSNTEQNVLLEV